MKVFSVGKQGHQAIVDDEDFRRVMTHHWKMNRDQLTGAVFAYAYKKSGNLTRSGRRERVQLSHFVLGLEKGERIYHLNRNRLDCRKENLFRKNGGNVWVDEACKRKPYKATIWIKDRNFYLGHYPTKSFAHEVIEYALPVAAEYRKKPISTRELQRALDLAVGRDA